MKTFNSIRRPFKRGKCRKCHSEPLVRLGTLCPECSAYADQDYAPQKALLCSTRHIEQLSDEIHEPEHIEKTESHEVETKRSHAQSLLSKAGLTARQKQIIKFIFAEQQTFEQISIRLRISRSSIQSYAERALEKLHFCRTRALLSKGKKISTSTPAPLSLEATAMMGSPIGHLIQDLSAPEPKLADTPPEAETNESEWRSGYRHICPRCGDRVFWMDRDFQYCFHCLWDSDSDSGLLDR